MPAPTDTEIVVSPSTVAPLTAAVTVTDRFDTPSPIEVWAPWVPPSASTDRATVPESPIVNDAELIVKPDAEVVPVIDRASASAVTLSVLVVIVNVPEPLDEPSAIVISNDSSPAGIE